MSATILVTRNVSDRIRGFLASSMLELAPGVYAAVRFSPAVRERVWEVLEKWFVREVEASIVMVWRDPAQPGEMAVRVLGLPPIDVVQQDGMLLARRPGMWEDEKGKEKG
ncbi:MAG: CRISPR-associated protein Cas2 [Hydrogenibacillus schlegelii]|uniref:CRISPR-associated protein Cas2 n=1 Tax=Hydrogenibacillus schlegelii TaxID=1484 RepID=A0A2T5G9I1_HYDSH|nr:type I-E CRISPR-associated endoribonuclease Cas2e [Hydrogenibacillus schlegelii]PTQ52808.1 MAG: CRISPR-associated protein Cas2 [Hydrogenibacillus schlegelii]